MSPPDLAIATSLKVLFDGQDQDMIAATLIATFGEDMGFWWRVLNRLPLSIGGVVDDGYVLESLEDEEQHYTGTAAHLRDTLLQYDWGNFVSDMTMGVRDEIIDTLHKQGLITPVVSNPKR